MHNGALVDQKTFHAHYLGAQTPFQAAPTTPKPQSRVFRLHSLSVVRYLIVRKLCGCIEIHETMNTCVQMATGCCNRISGSELKQEGASRSVQCCRTEEINGSMPSPTLRVYPDLRSPSRPSGAACETSNRASTCIRSAEDSPSPNQAVVKGGKHKLGIVQNV